MHIIFAPKCFSIIPEKASASVMCISDFIQLTELKKLQDTLLPGLI